MHDYPSMAGDILRFLATRDLRDIVLLGHSMGGKAAMELALTASERVSRLIVVDIAPRSYPYAPAKEVLDALLAIDLSHATSRQEIDDQLAARGLDRRLRGFLLMGLARTHDARLRWRFNLRAIAANWSRLGDAISDGRFGGPTLVLRGEDSGYVTSDDLSAVQRYFPNARMVAIPGAQHWPHIDAPDETYREIREFLCN